MQNTKPVWLGSHNASNLCTLFLNSILNRNSIFATCDDGRIFTFGAFWDLAGLMANQLDASGAKQGDRIAVQVEKSIEALALFWACQRAGLIFLPLNTAYTMTEILYFLSDAEASAFIVSPEKFKDMQSIAKAAGCKIVLTLDDSGDGTLLKAGNVAFHDVETKWDDTAAILYTSGTTGRSKGAMLTHANLASNALALIQLWRFTADDVLLHALPVYHTHGLFVGMNTVLLSGGQLLFHRKFAADQVMRDLKKATCFMGVPTFYTRLLQHEKLTREATQHMRLFVSGSAPLLAETHREFENKTGHKILERYGMTETNMIASNPFEGDRIAGTVGFALPHVEIKITDATTAQELPQGEDGMIEVRGPNVFLGYWRNPEKTRDDKRENGFFITGDLGRIDDKGYLVISGRAKDLIITGGFNVYPKEIEEHIDALEGVTESAVIGVKHRDFGEAVTAVVATSVDLDEQAIIAELKTKLGSFKVPKRVLFVKDLPRNAMGKVQKAELRRIYAGLFDELRF
jgi:malonyl-CoA/methylmalonyl-CoA synthetase